MKLSISNLAWGQEHDETVYTLMKKMGYEGLEIVPTRIISEQPYQNLEKAKEFLQKMRAYELRVSSIQSIWYGKNQQLFGTEEERKYLFEYTKTAIDFAKILNCSNLVFGCPRNRNLPEGVTKDSATSFFRQIAEYASEHQVTVALEANPVIYNTNFINDTNEAIAYIRKIDRSGFQLNLDLGTILHNHESLDLLQTEPFLIHHVHVSEPGLVPINDHILHHEVAELLRAINYSGYVSIEMGKTEDLLQLERIMDYVREVFG